YREGHLKFSLDGQKLRGRWHLVRRGGSKTWLLFKSKDEFAKRGNGATLLKQAPDSALSGQSLAQVAEATDPEKPKQRSGKHRVREKAVPAQKRRISVAALPGARPAKALRSVSPELATLVTEVPDGDDWLHEMKFDGYRILLQVDGSTVRCLTRRGNDWAERLPHLVHDVAELGLPPTLLDGELCAVESDGTTNFQKLQNSVNADADAALVYFAFDLLHHDGTDLTDVPLIERKRVLAELLSRVTSPRLSLSEHVVGQGRAFFREACGRGLEGIVCKRSDSRYRSERTRDWLKVKCVRRHEVVIGGYTDPGGSRSHLGALLIGTHDERGGLAFRGKVGTGFTEQSLRELYERLKKLHQQRPPFVNAPRGAATRGVHWVKPELLAEVEYAELTRDGKLRHPRFRGLRQDKPAEAVPLEPSAKLPPRRASARPSSSLELPVELTHPDRVLYASQGLTKRALAEYFMKVAPWMLPYVQGRILTLVRCPQGQGGQCFFQKHAGKGMPEALRTIEIQERDKRADYLVLDDTAGLVSLVQMGALEVHVWGARADRPERPDQLVFDLDPGSDVAWGSVISATLAVRDQLSELGLTSFVKTSGGKGLHVVVPVERRVDWDFTRTFCRAVAERICRNDPKTFVCTMNKAKREGRIFIDYLRNSRGATSVCAFSPRAREGAPVSTPLAWSELTEELRPQEHNVLTVPDRLASLVSDPWAGYTEVHQSITKQMLRLLGGT
ncbi:MAG TPA: DNA ligase D, partial [Polyangiaceae bacterium]|nr:DNA ligase D [Polyangiaceae bacterium]